MKICAFCEKSMKTQNFKKHLDRCVIRKSFNLPKSEILLAIGGKPSNHESKSLESTIVKLSSDHLRLIHFIKRFCEEANSLLIEFQGEVDCFEKIQEMCLSSETIKEYQGEWRMFQKWCIEKHQNPMNPISANSYLSGLKLQVSTIKNKRNRLQSIIRHLTGQGIHLNRIRRRIRKIPKCKLSSEEIEAYLSEQKDINFEDYLIQSILAAFGCRLHSVSNLKLKNLDFPLIHLPDTKTGIRVVEASKDLQHLISKHIKMKKLTDPESFVFSAGSSLNLRRRSNNMCIRINKRLAESKVLKKNPNFKTSTHMFRHSRAFEVFRKHLEAGKAAARESIGHSLMSSSIDFYIN